MRIIYDGQVYDMQPVGGISRYFASIITRLPADFTPCLLVGKGAGGPYPKHPNLRVYGRGASRLESFSHRLGAYYSDLEARYLRDITGRRRFDLAHPTYYTLRTGQAVEELRCPVVLTVWDMIHEVFAAEMDPTGERAEEKRRAVAAAAAVICISENTKRDLLERFRLPEEKITVTHLASEIDESLSHGPEPVPDGPYYLYVGTRASHKNFGGLLKAFAAAFSSRPGVTLCVVGPAFNADERRLLAGLKLEGRVEHYAHVTDEHLAKLYRRSTAFVYPSLYEGFGLPVLEAMSCGAPVVSSNSSSLPEVVGGAGLLFDPRSTGDLVDILVGLLDNPAERERLIAEGRRRAREFTWDKTALKTLEVYRSVCD